MKKIFYTFLSLPLLLFAREKVVNHHGHNLLQARAAYFYFTEKSPRDVYGNQICSIEVENGYWFFPRWSFWQNVNVIWNDGKSYLGNPTNMTVTTISFGLKKYFPLYSTSMKWYLGVGPTIEIATASISDTPYLPNNNTEVGGGVVGKAGVLLQFTNNVVIDGFFDYYYEPIPQNVNSQNLDNWTDIGGFHAGAGIGYLF